MISVNATLLVQLIQFLVLVFILNRLMFKPLLKVIEARKEFTENTKQEIKDIQIRIGQLKEELVAEEQHARIDAAKKRHDIMNAGLTEAEGYAEASRKEAFELRELAENDAKEKTLETQPFIKEQALLLEQIIFEKILGRRVNS